MYNRRFFWRTSLSADEVSLLLERNEVILLIDTIDVIAVRAQKTTTVTKSWIEWRVNGSW